MACILLINPNTSTRSTEMMLTVARPLLPPGVTIRGVSASTGEAMILNETALAVGEQEVVRMGVTDVEGIDAIVVAAFGNPGADKLRAMLPIPSSGSARPPFRTRRPGDGASASPPPRHSLCVPSKLALIVFGLAATFTGVRVPGGDPLAFAANPADQDEALAMAATQCIELDGAEAVVIGGGPLSDTAARLRQRFQNEIVEPVPAAMRYILKALA